MVQLQAEGREGDHAAAQDLCAGPWLQKLQQPREGELSQHVHGLEPVAVWLEVVDAETKALADAAVVVDGQGITGRGE